jgi:hypothetical protein
MPNFESVRQHKEIRNLRKDADADTKAHRQGREQAERVVDSPGE